jgi:hypothetical protein
LIWPGSIALRKQPNRAEDLLLSWDGLSGGLVRMTPHYTACESSCLLYARTDLDSGCGAHIEIHLRLCPIFQLIVPRCNELDRRSPTSRLSSESCLGNACRTAVFLTCLRWSLWHCSRDFVVSWTLLLENPSGAVDFARCCLRGPA